MAVIKCKMCGGNLVLIEGQSVAECEYCGSRQTVPAADNEKKLIQFERAERLRKNCEFDKAAGLYEAIVSEFRQEAEAYWGLVLCKYGIEYVDDPAIGKKIPTCHRSSFDSIMEDSDFEQALENADAVARRVTKAVEKLGKCRMIPQQHEHGNKDRRKDGPFRGTGGEDQVHQCADNNEGNAQRHSCKSDVLKEVSAGDRQHST